MHRGEHIVALSAGTTHKPPPLDGDGFPVFESTAAAGYLIRRGIQPSLILCETASYDTIGNAYFARVIHTEPMGARKLAIITSDFHMPRTRAIFQWVFGLKPVKSPGFPNAGGDYVLFFEEVTDEGIDADMMAARKERESAALENVLHLQETIRTLEDFHRWFFRRHAAYSVSAQPERVKGVLLNMY
jgi:hypothetical protein